MCLTGLQLAPLILKALEQVDPEQKAEHVPNKAYAKIYEQAGACLATALSARAVQALHAAAQAHQISGSPAASSGRAGTSTGRSSSSSSTVWQRVQQLSEEAVKHMVSVQCAQDLHSSVRVACMASLAPAAAELRYLTALQGQHELQASLDRIFAESWPQQSFPAALHSAFGGCQLSHMLSPEVSACLADGLSSELGPGQTGQQLRQRAADSALQPLQESWRSFLRGALHLLAASRLQREGAVLHRQDIEAWSVLLLSLLIMVAPRRPSTGYWSATFSERLHPVWQLAEYWRRTFSEMEYRCNNACDCTEGAVWPLSDSVLSGA